MTKLEQERTVFKDKLDELETKLNASKDEKTSMEEKFIELSDAFKKFKLESLVSQKTPIIDKIIQYEDASMKDTLKEVYLGWDVKKLENRLEEVTIKNKEATVLTKTLDKERKEALEVLKTKDVGMTALQGLKPEEMDIAKAIELEMKAEGLI